MTPALEVMTASELDALFFEAAFDSRLGWIEDDEDHTLKQDPLALKLRRAHEFGSCMLSAGGSRACGAGPRLRCARQN